MAVEAEALTFASWLQAELRSRGLSQEKAARQFDVSKNTVHLWTKGETEPRYGQIVRIWRAWGVLPPELMRVYLNGRAAVA